LAVASGLEEVDVVGLALVVDAPTSMRPIMGPARTQPPDKHEPRPQHPVRAGPARDPAAGPADSRHS
jgi:hypothetical protein